MTRSHRIIALAVLGLALLAACGAAPTSTAPAAVANPATMSVAELKQKLDAGTTMLLLDVRTPEEYSGDGHVAGSVLIPLQELEGRLGELPTDKPIACICRSGNRSAQACALLAQRGFTNLTNVEGGMIAWKAAGYPAE